MFGLQTRKLILYSAPTELKLIDGMSVRLTNRATMLIASFVQLVEVHWMIDITMEPSVGRLPVV